MNATRPTADAERIAEFYRAARELVLGEVGVGRVIRLPAVTAAGLEAVDALIRSRAEFSIAVGRLLRRAAGIPRASRRRRVLAALAKWLPGAPGYLLREETWFWFSLVRRLADEARGAATEAEVAGFIALLVLLEEGPDSPHRERGQGSR